MMSESQRKDVQRVDPITNPDAYSHFGADVNGVPGKAIYEMDDDGTDAWLASTVYQDVEQ